MKTKILVWIGVGVLLVAGLIFPRGNPVVQQAVDTVVGGTGQNWSFHQFFDQGLTMGGVMSTTTGNNITAYTTQAKDFAQLPTVIKWMPTANQTISLSATSTLALVPKVGDTANIYFQNASTTAAAAIIFAAASTNSDLQFAEASGGDLTLVGLDWMKITIIHKSTYDVVFILDEMTEAD